MNGPKLWQKLLDSAPKGAIIMGGAVVDYVLDVEPKDFDIFFTDRPGALAVIPAGWQLTEQDFNNPVWRAEHHEQYLQGVDGDGNMPIVTINEYLVDVRLVQMIGVHYPNPRQHFRNFDHSMTLAYFSEKGLFVSRKVFESIATKTITYVSTNQDPIAKAKSLARAKKKAARYGGNWSFIGFE